MNHLEHIDDPQKHEINKQRRFSFRLNLFFFCTFFIFSVLIVRLAILQFVEGKQLSAQKLQSTIKPVPIAPIRGNIYDREGYPIASSSSTQSLFYRIEPGQKPEQVIALAKRLADIFAKYKDKKSPDLTADQVIRRMDVGYDINQKETTPPSYAFSPRRIKAGLSKNEIAYLMEHRDEFSGIEIVEESTRTYDPSRVAVQLVGYLRPFSVAREERNGLEYYKKIAKSSNPENKYLDTEDVGFNGLEFIYQEELRGKNGIKSYPVNAEQKIVGSVSIKYPEKGNNLYLTIDKDVQLATQQAIMDHLKEIRTSPLKYVRAPYARSGYAVAMEVDTGKVIAMASMPDYDPNVWEGGISKEEYQQIQPFINNGTITTAYSDYPEKELPKHPTSIVPLGSTMKPLTVLLGLNEGLLTPNETYRDVGIFYFGRNNSAFVRNSNSKAYGTLTAQTAITHSSNTFMSAMIGNRLYMKYGNKGVDIWDDYMEKFGLGVLTGSGLPNEIKGIKEYESEVKRGSAQSALIYASFGQQGRYTTLQLAQYAAMLGNRGKRMKPIFVDKITTYNGDLVKKFQPVVLNEVKIPKQYWDLVQRGMEGVSKGGFEGFPYKVAAKTGTSQQDVGGSIKENAVFIAYAPADKPKLAVAVVVPEGGYGAWGAAPIARKIFDAYDRQFGLDGVPKAPEGTGEQISTQ